MRLKEFKEMLKTIESEDFTIKIEEGRIIIEESLEDDVLDTIKLFIKDDSKIIQTASGYKIDTTGIASAQRLWRILVSMYGDNYDISTPNENTVVIKKKAQPNTQIDNKGLRVKEGKINVNEIEQFIKSTGIPGLKVEIENDKILVTGDDKNLEELADMIEQEYPELTIVLDLDGLKISEK
jgi:CO dehydrogenase/acetyl-CoA synthase epsilon subunit